jgi:hypothetical protein
MSQICNFMDAEDRSFMKFRDCYDTGHSEEFLQTYLFPNKTYSRLLQPEYIPNQVITYRHSLRLCAVGDATFIVIHSKDWRNYDDFFLC